MAGRMENDSIGDRKKLYWILLYSLRKAVRSCSRMGKS